MGSVQQKAQAGSLESGDILVMVSPAENDGDAVIELESLVMPQYGRAIHETIKTILEKNEVRNVCIKAIDRGALDFAIRARVLAALLRAGVSLKEESE